MWIYILTFLFSEAFGGFCMKSYSCYLICSNTTRYCGGLLFLSSCRYRTIFYPCIGTCYRHVCCDGYTGISCDMHKDECKDSKSGCSQLCVNSDKSFTCGCRKGYFLSMDNKACLDTDECSSGGAGCVEYCNKTPGSYNCYCGPGYFIGQDNITCQVAARYVSISANFPFSTNYTISINDKEVLNVTCWSTHRWPGLYLSMFIAQENGTETDLVIGNQTSSNEYNGTLIQTSSTFTFNVSRAWNGCNIGCKASNIPLTDVRSETIKLHIRSKPTAPQKYGFKTDLTTETTATIWWEPGFNGGFPQQFTISYRLSSNYMWSNISSIPETENNTMNQTIMGLESGSRYHVLIYTENKLGSARIKEEFIVETKGITKTAKASSIVGPVIGGSVAFAVLGTAVVVIILRNRSSCKTKEDSKIVGNFENNTYQNSLFRDGEHTPSTDGLTSNVYEGLQITGKSDYEYSRKEQPKTYENLRLTDRNEDSQAIEPSGQTETAFQNN